MPLGHPRSFAGMRMDELTALTIMPPIDRATWSAPDHRKLTVSGRHDVRK
jgi:hypothetical protein